MNKFIIKSPVASDNGALIGKNPNEVTVEEWLESDFSLATGLDAIRENCKSCAGDDWSEVSKCSATSCVFWPLRLGKVPKNFRVAKEIRANE